MREVNVSRGKAAPIAPTRARADAGGRAASRGPLLVAVPSSPAGNTAK